MEKRRESDCAPICPDDGPGIDESLEFPWKSSVIGRRSFGEARREEEASCRVRRESMVRVGQYIRGGKGGSGVRIGEEHGAAEEDSVAKGVGSGVGGKGGRTEERWVVRSRGSGANICLPPGKLKAHREERIETRGEDPRPRWSDTSVPRESGETAVLENVRPGEDDRPPAIGGIERALGAYATSAPLESACAHRGGGLAEAEKTSGQPFFNTSSWARANVSLVNVMARKHRRGAGGAGKGLGRGGGGRDGGGDRGG
ncbi:hypothetical protein KM043_000544 [Ampulex compressa]|nr:hypothetical protein KM043_000544 [Ampulex compressa]